MLDSRDKWPLIEVTGLRCVVLGGFVSAISRFARACGLAATVAVVAACEDSVEPGYYGSYDTADAGSPAGDAVQRAGVVEHS